MVSFLKKTYVELAQPKYDLLFIAALLFAELGLGALIIWKVPYTEIDWEAYMEEVDWWWQEGEYDYRKIYGGTGPLVYPAGFLYLFRVLQVITNRDIYMAQWVFLGFYLATQAVVLAIYNMILQQIRRKLQTKEAKTTTIDISSAHPIWSFRVAMGCLCLSKRYHSIFLLRLFNDGPTMLVAYASIWLFMNKRWNLGCFVFSLAVSLKMNVLLFAPGLLYLLIQDNLNMTIPRLAICAVTQLILGAPFLLRHPISYLRKAFELDRQFFYKWTVNFKFLPEDVFLSKPWAVLLLALHLGLLAVYHYRLHAKRRQSNTTTLSSEQILSTMLISNFVGICCARTLHYQFYCWYFSGLPYLVWRKTPYPLPVKLCLLSAIEYAFLTFPATALSSAVLQVAHWAILVPCVLIVKQQDDTVQLSITREDETKKDK